MTFLDLLESAGQRLKAWVLADVPPPAPTEFTVSGAADVDVTGRQTGDALVVNPAGDGYVHAATIPASDVLVIVQHGADANVARPVGVGGVLWVGSVQPANWQAPDIWNDTVGA